MISNSKIKLISSLKQKKGRVNHGLFVVEGDKMILDLIRSSFNIYEIFALPEWIEKHRSELNYPAGQLHLITASELKKISFLTTPHNVLALIRLPGRNKVSETGHNELILALDSIQDPGNMGTIIRIAAWFGIRTILCSHETVDIFSPKVIQSSMSAIFHVNIYYVSLKEKLKELSGKGIPVFGSYTEGKSLYEQDLPSAGVLLMGNESMGISHDLDPFISQKIAIPGTGDKKPIDSLNVATATAILCAEFKRKNFIQNEMRGSRF